MNVTPQRPIFNRKPESNLYRMFFWIVLVLGGFWLIRQVEQGNIKPLFLPTPTPTRNAVSYTLEGDAQFTAGNIDKAITAYDQATQVDPSNGDIWAKLARIQAYSSAYLTKREDRLARLKDALASADQAVALAPDDSTVHGIRAFTLDWLASPYLTASDKASQAQGQDYLAQAEQEALKALQIDPNNAQALSFYAEILVDQQKWTQAEQYIQNAVNLNPSLMDVHRVYAYVLESLGEYNQAIQEYDKAIALAPNLTFLYLRAGANYRILGFRSPNEAVQKQLFDSSLEYFAKAAAINDQLQVHDPTPYLSIAKTYSQEGEYFIAARNVQKALEFDPSNADTYGQLGIIYQKSRNYEGAIPALKCAVAGCNPQESCDGRGGCGPNDVPAQVTGLPLSPDSVVYYYTYGSILAALSRPDQNYCPQAISVLEEIRPQYGDDPNIAGIIQAGEAICSTEPDTTSSNGALSLPTPTLNPAAGAPGPLIVVTITPGPTPTP